MPTSDDHSTMSTKVIPGSSVVIARYYLEATDIATSDHPTIKLINCFTGNVVPADWTINTLIRSFQGDPSRDQLIVWSRDETRKWAPKNAFSAEPENERHTLNQEGWAGRTHDDPVRVTLLKWPYSAIAIRSPPETPQSDSPKPASTPADFDTPKSSDNNGGRASLSVAIPPRSPGFKSIPKWLSNIPGSTLESDVPKSALTPAELDTQE